MYNLILKNDVLEKKIILKNVNKKFFKKELTNKNRCGIVLSEKRNGGY